MSLAGRLAVLLACAAGAACGSTSFYDWGRYEDSVYVVTSTPDGFDLAAEIESLETQLEIAANRERPVPPGFHAHLGTLLSVAGNPDGARRHFEAEKELFPESTRFMDQLLARLAPSS